MTHPYQITNNSIMIVIDGTPHEVDSTQPNFKPLRDAILNSQWDEVSKHLTVAQTISQWTHGDFYVKEDHVYYQNEPLPSAIARRILQMITAGNNDPQPLLKAWIRIEENPSYRSRQQLFEFLALHPGIPLTEDGHLLFYKNVQTNFRDHHSGKFDSSPGQTLFMKRNRVSDDPTKPCHFGFHVGTRKYAQNFVQNGRIIICKVDPADIVCVPHDCSQQKVRTHRYTVVGLDNGNLLPDTTQELDVETPTHTPAPSTVKTHTDGSQLEPDETPPKAPDDHSQAVKLPITGTEWDYMNNLDSIQLLQLPIAALRSYARFNLLIIGASKLPGGKTALVSAISQIRDHQ